MYVEASGRSNNEKAVMYSPFYQSLDNLCLGFFYHMYGRQIGTLNVFTKVGNTCTYMVNRKAY